MVLPNGLRSCERILTQLRSLRTSGAWCERMRFAASRDEDIACELMSEFGDKALAPTLGGTRCVTIDVPVDQSR